MSKTTSIAGRQCVIEIAKDGNQVPQRITVTDDEKRGLTITVSVTRDTFDDMKNSTVPLTDECLYSFAENAYSELVTANG